MTDTTLDNRDVDRLYTELAEATEDALAFLPAVPRDESPSSYTEEQTLLCRLAEGWRDLDLALNGRASDDFATALPGGWGFRLPPGHYAVPDGSIAVTTTEPALIFHDGQGTAHRLDVPRSGMFAPLGRRARAILAALLAIATEDLEQAGSFCGDDGSRHHIYELCDRRVGHGGRHTNGTNSWD